MGDLRLLYPPCALVPRFLSDLHHQDYLPVLCPPLFSFPPGFLVLFFSDHSLKSGFTLCPSLKLYPSLFQPTGLSSSPSNPPYLYQHTHPPTYSTETWLFQFC